VSKTVGALTTVFVNDGLQEIAEYENGTLARSYVFGSYIDEPLLMVAAGVKTYYHANNLYSVAALTNQAGAVVERYTYDPYGKVKILAADGVTVLAASSVGNPWTFTGRRLDGETGLMYYRARMYDVGLGRFIGRDPIGYVDGLSTYCAYFAPNSVDPTGYEEGATPGAGQGSGFDNETTVVPSETDGWAKNRDRWSMPAKDFRDKYMSDTEKDVGNTIINGIDWYSFGCKGVTHCMMQKTNSEVSQCYEKEESAVEKAKEKRCPPDEHGCVYGVRYWDPQKDQRQPNADGSYPVDKADVERGKPGAATTNFDYGYRQSNGSYIHADHAEPGMNVKISPSSNEFAIPYEGFNSVVYCVRCCPCKR